MEKIEDILFYTIDKSIKTYRQFAQKRIKDSGYSVTIDQWLVLKNIQEFPGINQQDLSKKVFKDNASVTRIIELLVQSQLLERSVNEGDRRRTFITITQQGLKTLQDVQEIVLQNRAKALKGLDSQELKELKKNLQKIIDNIGED